MNNSEEQKDVVIVEPEDLFLVPETPNNEPIDSYFQREIDELYDEINGEKKLTNVDFSERESDWVKSLSWDLPNTAETLIKAIGGPDKWEKFKTLPAFIPMPEKLKTEVELYLKDEKVAE
jgi:hypothetical protein